MVNYNKDINNNCRILMLGDAVGAPGRAMYQKYIPKIKEKYSIDAVIVNGENSANDGKGITSKIMKFFNHIGVNMVTTGNHIWRKRDIYSYLESNSDLLRPANFPSCCPGKGVGVFEVNGFTIGVINLIGRSFMRDQVDDPFRAADSIITFLKPKTNIILIDFHAETTAEKAAFAYYMDGRVSGVVGTHTHVQTSDERIMPRGTAFITDLGMAGAVHSLIGMKKENIISSTLSQMPTRFEVETEGPMQICGVWIEVDSKTGHAVAIERVRIIDEELKLDDN